LDLEKLRENKIFSHLGWRVNCVKLRAYGTLKTGCLKKTKTNSWRVRSLRRKASLIITIRRIRIKKEKAWHLRIWMDKAFVL